MHFTSVSKKNVNLVVLQIPGSTHYSMVFYFVMKQLVSGSLLQRFVDGDDEFRNSRFKLIPSVPKVSISFLLQLILSITPDYPLKGFVSSFLDSSLFMQGSWIVRQSVGSSPCLLGKAVDCTYIRRPKYLEVTELSKIICNLQHEKIQDA